MFKTNNTGINNNNKDINNNNIVLWNIFVVNDC